MAKCVNDRMIKWLIVNKMNIVKCKLYHFENYNSRI